MERLGLLSNHFTSINSVRDLLKVEIADKVATVQMNPPSKFVFMSKPLMRQINDQLEDLEKNPDVNVIILTGNEHSFTTGADIKEISLTEMKDQIFDDYFEREWFRVIPKCRKPLIAQVSGYCFGGGFEVAMMCDIIIASQDAKFSQPEIALGVIPGGGGTQRLTSLVGKSKAMEMILAGEAITAQEALQWHIVSRVVPKDSLKAETMKLAKKIASYSQLAAAMGKRAINTSLEQGLSSGIEHERTLFMSLLSTSDKKEGTAAFQAKRPAKFTNS